VAWLDDHTLGTADEGDNKGVEPEGLAVATFGHNRYAFVGMERTNLVAVYDVNNPRRPRFLQALPTGVAPEGLLPIPQTGTLVVSAEEDSAEDNDGLEDAPGESVFLHLGRIR
jgi:hypothetical protein